MNDKEYRVGTIGYPVTRARVLAEVDVVELTDAAETPPKQSTAKKWRESAPASTVFSVQLPQYLFEEPPASAPLPGESGGYGYFRTSEENLKLWEKTMRFVEALEARSLVLLTPAAFTPTGANRRALFSFLDAVDAGDREIVWEPHGPWEHEQAMDFAGELGVVLAVDPLRDAPPAGEAAYFRLGPFAALGSRVGVYDLERLTEALLSFRRATCVFQTSYAFDDARNLKKVIAESLY